jgi:hypothetical protein
VLRETGDDPILVVHSRARGYRPDLPQTSADALLSVAGDVGGLASHSPLLQRLIEVLQADGLSHEMVDGRAATAGYEVGNIPQSLYLQASRNKLFSAIWLSPQTRASYAQQDDQRQESLRFRALGIASSEQDLGEFVRQHRDAAATSSVPDDLRAAIRRYQGSSDVVTLARIRELWPDYRWQRVIDRDSRQSFLAVFDKNKELELLANLNPRQQDAVIHFDAHGPGSGAIKQFLNTRAALLEFGEMQ